MKTLKLTLVATLVAFAMVSAANADGFKSKPPKFTLMVRITIEKALQNPVLVTAMYDQLDPGQVLNFPLPPITVEVKCKNSLYRITGTREEWVRFFKRQGVNPGPCIKIGPSTE